MAYAMIDDLGLRKGLSNIRITKLRNGQFKASATGGSVSNLQTTDSGLKFDWLADGLPWVLPEEAQPGVDLLHLGHKATREALEVHGLGNGKYDLLIDGNVVGTYWEASLARHIELQGNTKTPQYQQALQVAMLNKKKNEGPVRSLRDGWRTFQGWARMDDQLKNGQLTGQYREDTAKRAAQARERLNGLEKIIQDSEAEAAEIEDEIYKVNQPVVRHFELRKAE